MIVTIRLNQVRAVSSLIVKFQVNICSTSTKERD